MNLKLIYKLKKLWYFANRKYEQVFIRDDKRILKRQVRQALNRKLELTNPVFFNDKIQWLKLYWRNEKASSLVDKYEVREYVKSKGYPGILIKCYGVYDDFQEINFDLLPDKFVIKSTNGSGNVYIVKDKSSLNLKALSKIVNSWMRQKFHNFHVEWVYEQVKNRIIIEEFLNINNESPSDFKFLCFNGEPRVFFVTYDREIELKIDFYDLDWNKLPFHRVYKNSTRIEKKPLMYDKILQLCRVLSAEFPFVRVDLYIVGDQIYFSELTFFPGSGLEAFTPEIYDKVIGDYLVLPNGGTKNDY